MYTVLFSIHYFVLLRENELHGGRRLGENRQLWIVPDPPHMSPERSGMVRQRLPDTVDDVHRG